MWAVAFILFWTSSNFSTCFYAFSPKWKTESSWDLNSAEDNVSPLKYIWINKAYKVLTVLNMMLLTHIYYNSTPLNFVTIILNSNSVPIVLLNFRLVLYPAFFLQWVPSLWFPLASPTWSFLHVRVSEPIESF